MSRRLPLLFAVAVLAFAGSSYGSDRGYVDDVEAHEIKVGKVGVLKDGVEIEPPNEVSVKGPKVGRDPPADVDVMELAVKPVKVMHPFLEGIPDLKKPPPPDDQEIADQAAQKAEGDQGGPGGGQQQMAEQRAEYEGSVRAEQQAVDQGKDMAEAHDIGEATRRRIQDDYGRAADGGSLSAPPEDKKAAPPPAPAETQPEVLEPPPQEGAPGEGAPDSSGGPQVIDVPQQR
ncbi:MAG TPA: hypothetical protein VMB50_14685 [Myxococcales bacterium]|nr:hypothetical protein [Myxococcales bacterium]